MEMDGDGQSERPFRHFGLRQGYRTAWRRRTRIVRIPCLSLAHHVDDRDAGEANHGARLRFEAEHGSNAALDTPVILFDPIVEAPAYADADRLQRSLPQAAFSVAGTDHLVVGLAAVEDDAAGRPCRACALRRKPLAATRSRFSLKRLSMAR